LNPAASYQAELKNAFEAARALAHLDPEDAVSNSSCSFGP
jgi:hypothetical protein